MSLVKIVRIRKFNTFDLGCSAISFRETMQQRGRTVLCNTSDWWYCNAFNMKYLQMHCCFLFWRCWAWVIVLRKLLWTKRVPLIRWKFCPAPISTFLPNNYYWLLSGRNTGWSVCCYRAILTQRVGNSLPAFVTVQELLKGRVYMLTCSLSSAARVKLL